MKGYRCLDRTTGWVVTSHHVQFVTDVVPFHALPLLSHPSLINSLRRFNLYSSLHFVLLHLWLSRHLRLNHLLLLPACPDSPSVCPIRNVSPPMASSLTKTKSASARHLLLCQVHLFLLLIFYLNPDPPSQRNLTQNNCLGLNPRVLTFLLVLNTPCKLERSPIFYVHVMFLILVTPLQLMCLRVLPKWPSIRNGNLPFEMNRIIY